jgi:hypothetical protein
MYGTRVAWHTRQVLYEVEEELDATGGEESQKGDDDADVEEELDLVASMREEFFLRDDSMQNLGPSRASMQGGSRIIRT